MFFSRKNGIQDESENVQAVTRMVKKSISENNPKNDAALSGVKLKKKYFEVSFYHDWCKACGICMAFCPKQIIKKDKAGRPVIEEPDICIGCRFCEIHCPDFAVSVSRRVPKRRKTDV